MPRFGYAPLLACALVFASRAHAHDQWADGTQVPAWVKSWCCGEADAHRDPDAYQDDAGDWHVRGLNGVKHGDEILPSQDGHIWAFFNDHIGPGATIYCLFVPMGA